MLDEKAFADLLVGKMREATAPLYERIALLEKTLAALPAPKDGADGRDGINGADGKDGIDGKEGIPGTKGLDGEPGKDGEAGKDGRDGVDGRAGEQGLQGLAGEKGEDGKDGLSGKDGRDGVDGKDGAPGLSIKGDAGDAGKDGTNGLDGRDAIHLEVLPTIDETKSYPRNTYATNRGGFWRSFETTAGMKGWECLVDGDAEESIEFADDQRTVTVRKVKSSGKVIERSMVLPAMIYREIFVEGKTYERGDVATWGGSTWHCNESTTEKPGDGKAWRLMVKKGANGKDGDPGKKGDPGRDGKDFLR